MKRLLSLLFIAAAAVSFGQDWAKSKVDASPRHQEWVKIKAGDREVESFVVYPEVREKAPVVIVIHEIFGMTDWIQYVTDRLAENGYIAIAPDLLSGMGPDKGRSSSFADVGKAREAVSNLAPDQVTSDLMAVSDYGKALPASNGKLAVSGFCWGGTQTFLFATKRADLSASFVYYGSGPGDVGSINAPVYGFYGENDARINATLPETEKLMKDAGKTFVAVIYDEAGHGFLRAGAETVASEANRTAMEAAWKRWFEVLGPLKTVK